MTAPVLPDRMARLKLDPVRGVPVPWLRADPVDSAPPSHRECAIYAAQACPFLANPERRRREGRLPDGVSNPAGEMIRRNPGVTLVWTSKAFTVWNPRDGRGVLIDIGKPHEALWFSHGRAATREEVEASIESGLPLLHKMAEDEGPKAVAQLQRQTEAARVLLPGGVS